MEPIDPRHGRPVRVIMEDLKLHRIYPVREQFSVVDKVGNIFIFNNEQARFEYIDEGDKE